MPDNNNKKAKAAPTENNANTNNSSRENASKGAGRGDKLNAVNQALGVAQNAFRSDDAEGKYNNAFDVAKGATDAIKDAKKASESAKKIAKGAKSGGATGAVIAVAVEAIKDPNLFVKTLAIALSGLMLLGAVFFALGYALITAVQNFLDEVTERFYEESTGDVVNDFLFGPIRVWGSYLIEGWSMIFNEIFGDDTEESYADMDKNDALYAAESGEAVKNILRRRIDAIQTRVQERADQFENSLELADFFSGGLGSTNQVTGMWERCLLENGIWVELSPNVSVSFEANVSDLEAVKLLTAYSVEHDVDYNSVTLKDIMHWIGSYHDLDWSAVDVTAENGSAENAQIYIAGTKDENTRNIFFYLSQEIGYEDSVACAILGNLEYDSDLKTTNLEDEYEATLGYTDESYTQAIDERTYSDYGSDGAGYGLCMWRNDRKTRLVYAASVNNVSVGSLGLQLDYLVAEMRSRDFGTESALTEIENTEDGVMLAAKIFALHHVNSAMSDAEVADRQSRARNFWVRYKSGEFEDVQRPNAGSSQSPTTSVDISNTELAYFPAKSFLIYQGDMDDPHSTHAHSNTYALDIGERGGTCSCYAPFTMQIKYISQDGYNIVIAQSMDKVQFANGDIDYMCVMLEHDSDISGLTAQQIIPQGQEFYQQGTANTETPHVHIEFAKGQYYSNMAHGGIQCTRGTGCRGTHYGMDPAVRIKATEACCLFPGTVITQDRGYHFRSEEDVRRVVHLDSSCLIIGDAHVTQWKAMQGTSISSCKVFASDALGVTTTDVQVNGKTVNQYLEANAGGFDSVIIMLGRNDVERTDQIEGRYASLLSKIYSINPDATVVMCTALPVNDTAAEENGYDITNAQIVSVNQKIRSVYNTKSSTYGGHLNLVDINTHFLDANGTLRFSNDGVLMTNDGYRELDNYITQVISSFAVSVVAPGSDNSSDSENQYIIGADEQDIRIFVQDWHGSFVPQYLFETYEQMAEEEVQKREEQGAYVLAKCESAGDALMDDLIYIPTPIISNTVTIYPRADDPHITDEMRRQNQELQQEYDRIHEAANSQGEGESGGIEELFSPFSYICTDGVAYVVSDPDHPVFCPRCCSADSAVAERYRELMDGAESGPEDDEYDVSGNMSGVEIGRPVACPHDPNHHLIRSGTPGRAYDPEDIAPRPIYLSRYTFQFEVRARSADDIATNVIGFWDGPLERRDESGFNRYSSNPDRCLLAYGWVLNGKTYHRMQGYQLSAYRDAALSCAAELGIDASEIEDMTTIYNVTDDGSGAAYVAVAENEYNTHGGINNGFKYKQELHFPQSYQWCCIFTCWCAKQLGYYESGVFPIITASCAGLYGAFEHMGRTYTRTDDPNFMPQAGDLIFFDGDDDHTFFQHIGIVASVDEQGHVHTVEGNMGDGVVGHGTYSGIWSHAWTRSNGEEIYITAYARPDFSLGAPAASQPTPSDPSDQDLQRALNELITSELNSQQGIWSLYIEQPSTGLSVSYNNRQMISASLIKLFVAGAYGKAMNTGIEGDSLLPTMDSMIRVSSNDACNLIIDELGFTYINDFISENGFASTVLQRKMLAGGNENFTSAQDCVKILKMIDAKTLISSDFSTRVLDDLKNQDRRMKIPAGIPSGITVANKTGELDEPQMVENDAAIVYAPAGTYYICIMCSGVPDRGAARTTIVSLSRNIFNLIGNQ